MSRFSLLKKLKITAVVLLTAVWMTYGCAGAGARTETDSVKGDKAASDAFFPHEKSDLSPDPSLKFGRLDNGFRYVLMANSEPKDRVSMHLDVQAGSLDEKDNQRGLAHFLEHMVFNGTEHFPPGELVKYFQRIGMSFGPDANAHTGFNETVFDILLPDGDSKSIDEGLLVMRDYAAGALLLKDQIDDERGVILSEKQVRDTASYRTFESTWRFEMKGTRVAHRLPIGTEASIRAANRARLKDFYDTWYRPDKMILVMVGDFNADKAESMIKARFSGITARAPRRQIPPVGRLDHEGISPFYHYEKEAGDTSVSIEVLSSEPRQDDSLAYEKKELLREIAHRIVQNRLDRMLDDAKTPFTSAYISSGRFLNEIAYSEISAKGPPGTWRQRLFAIEHVLRQALVYGFTREELGRVRKEMLAEMDTAVRKASTRESQDLARNIIRDLNDDRVFQSPEQEKKEFSPFISSLTTEQVARAFRKAWDRNHRLVLVTGNARIAEGAETGRKEILSAFKASRRQAVSPPEKNRAAAFPFFQIPKAAERIHKQRTIDDLGIVQVDFANGVRLNFKRTDFKADEVSIRLAFGRGRAGEPETLPGLSDVSQGVVNESGVGPLTLDALKRALAGKSTDIDFQVKEDHFSFEESTVPDELELAFQLLYGHLTAPAFRKDALDLTIRRLSQRYDKYSRSVLGQMKIEGDRFLAGGDSRFGMSDPHSLERIGLKDVENWVGAAIRQGKLEVSVVGDVDAQRVISLAGRYLGSLKPRGGVARETQRPGPAFPAGKSRTLKVPTKIVKSLVVVSWPTDDFWDIHRTRRLSVLGSVISEELRTRIREKLGVAYSPYAYNDPSRAYTGYGRLMAIVPTDPKTAREVVSEVHKIADKLVKAPLHKDEVKRIMTPILTGLKDLRRTNDYWIDSVLTGSVRHPRQLDWARSIVKDYRSIGAADILKTARTYLNNKKSATVVIVPESP